MKDVLTFYSPAEERLNVISHGIGFALSIVAFVSLISTAINNGTIWHLVSFCIYGASLVLMYTASTLYHYVQEPGLRCKLNIFDHAAIYVLIAGSYTPYTLNVLGGTLGWSMFVVIWAFAICGITLKLFFFGKYGKTSVCVYIVMGWLGIFGVKTLLETMPVEGVIWLVAGGISYTVGVILYGLKEVKFNHAIFHLFVLLGSICHFMSVFLYISPKSNSWK